MIELFWFLFIVFVFCCLAIVALGIVYVFGGDEMKKQIREDW